MKPEYRLILMKRALRDLQLILAFVARKSPAYAPVVVERILQAIETLEIFPHHNVAMVDNQKWPIRSLPVMSYLVFFRVDDDRKVVRILRIRHGARKPLRRF